MEEEDALLGEIEEYVDERLEDLSKAIIQKTHLESLMNIMMSMKTGLIVRKVLAIQLGQINKKMLRMLQLLLLMMLWQQLLHNTRIQL